MMMCDVVNVGLTFASGWLIFNHVNVTWIIKSRLFISLLIQCGENRELHVLETETGFSESIWQSFLVVTKSL